MPRKAKEIVVGQKFNRLTVIGFHHKENGAYYYSCRCDCGKIKIVRKQNLFGKGSTKSCGCYLGTHHMTSSRLYRIWISMKSRCYNQNFKHYLRYGGRGITVCDEWKNDFMAFYNWAMSNGYREDLTIDRIDNNGNYEPSNCRWADWKTQNRNTRRNRLLFYNGKTLCVSEWAETIGIKCGTLFQRIRKGMTAKEAIEYKAK